MRYLLLALALPLTACTTAKTPPDAPKPPQIIGMANPASVYCLEKGECRSPFKVRRAFVLSANYRGRSD
jgi:putative hemolysin